MAVSALRLLSEIASVQDRELPSRAAGVLRRRKGTEHHG